MKDDGAYEVVDRLEGIAKKFCERMIKDKFSVTKFRWDAPDITIDWMSDDGIGRNIHIVVIWAGGYWLNSEVNIWKDNDEGLERRWFHSAGPDTVALRSSSDFSDEEIVDITVMLGNCYKMVQNWTEDNLIFIGKLQPDPRK